MKSTGIIKRVDILGRISLPIDIRRDLNIDGEDDVEIFAGDDMIFIRKYIIGCAFCGSTENLHRFKEKSICSICAKEL